MILPGMANYRWLLVVAVTAICGCASTPDFADAHVPTAALKPTNVLVLPPGSRVKLNHVVTEPNTSRFTVGTVLKAGPEGVALANCECVGRTQHATPVFANVPYVNRLFKNTGVGNERVPVMWIPFHDLVSVEMIAPPPEGYDGSTVDIDLRSDADFERIGTDFESNLNEMGSQPVMQPQWTNFTHN